MLPSIWKKGRYDLAAPDSGDLVLRRHGSLKISQRLRLLEMAYRMNDMEDSGKQRLFSDYDRLCTAFKKAEPDGLDKHFNRFITDRCELAEDARVGATLFYVAFREWYNIRGIPIPTQRSFGRVAAARFFRQKNGTVVYRGVWLRAETGTA